VKSSKLIIEIYLESRDKIDLRFFCNTISMSALEVAT